MLLDVKRSLSPAKILQYKEIARQDGTELDEEILLSMFGPERLKAYRRFFCSLYRNLDRYGSFFTAILTVRGSLLTVPRSILV